MDKAAFRIYLIILILSPILFGAVHTYAYTLMALGVLFGSLLLLIRNIKKDPKSDTYQFRFPNTSLNITIIMFLVFLIIQVIPLPGFLLGFLSPEAQVAGEKSLSASKTWFALSPYYYPVRMSIIRFAVYGMFFLGFSQVLDSQKRIEIAIFFILMLCCFEAIYGLIQTYSGSGHILWYKKGAYRQDVCGTYINRNHLAGLLEMGLLLAVSYSAGLSERKKKRRIASSHKASLRVKVSQFLSGEQRFNKRTIILFSGAVMGIGLIFSASRGGMLAAAGAMLCMSLFFIFKKDHRKKGFFLLFLFLITSVYALHIGVEYPIGRFKYFDSSYEARSRYEKKTLEMFDQYKLAGVGVGNFRYAYPKYQATEDKKKFFRFAHNDWAQFLSEAGIIGLCLLITGISYFVYRTIKLWKRRSDPFAVCLGIVPFAVIAAMGIHSYSDFNLHIPANFLMLVAIMAIGYSALRLERRRGRDKTLYRYHTQPLKYKGLVSLCLILGLIFWTGFWTIRHFMAEVNCNTVNNSTLNRDQNPPLEEIKNAIFWDRSNAKYWYKLWIKLNNLEIEGLRSIGSQDRKELKIEIVRALEEAVRLNPFEPEYHLRLGWAYAYMWHDPDYYKKWLPAADISMDRAAYFTGDNNPYLYVMMGHYWVMRSKTLQPSDPKREIAWAKACSLYKKNLSLETGNDRKRMINEIRKNVWVHYPDELFIKQAIGG